MNPIHYRNRWLKQLNRYERVGIAVMRSHFRILGDHIPVDQMTSVNYQDVITVGISLPDVKNAFLDLYLRVGLLHGKRVGEGIAKESKEWNWDEFESDFSLFIKTFFGTYVMASLIQNTSRSFRRYLINFFAYRLTQGTLEEAKTDLRLLIASRNFYDWQSLRVAKTEVVSAANLGAMKASEKAGIRMNKVWISATDDRTRRIPRDEFDHLQMHERIVPQEENFSVPKASGGFENLKFPGDPFASPGNRINCRCTVGFLPERDRNGDLIFTDSRPTTRRML